jgi:hypothetical protein
MSDTYHDLDKKYPALHITEILALIEMLERINKSLPVPKRAQEFAEYQHPAQTVMRLLRNDRVHPLETARVEGFKSRHGADIGGAMIHTGPYADEMARSMNALAVTIATDIYFRNSAYRPESEEGRQTLAHELTHVAQYKEGRIKPSAPRNELEAEAERAEAGERYDGDPLYTIEAGGRTLRLRKSQMPGMAKKVAREIREWLGEQKGLLGEEEYLRLLCSYDRWLKKGV